MASIRKEIHIDASPETAWAALRDVGALHTRLVPGFVTDTKLEDGARIVTFGNGMVARELIVSSLAHTSTREETSVSPSISSHRWSKRSAIAPTFGAPAPSRR